MSRRRSTIHDAAALRLHPSGVRVPLDHDVVQNPTSSILTAKHKTLVRRDARGNWIATDAGGDGRVTKRRKVTEVEEAKGAGAVAFATADGLDKLAETGSHSEEAPIKLYKDPRANRRAAFENDLTFLAAPASDPAKGDVSFHLQPSSDFLKCIHHFASQYYGSHGQLFDSAGQYRKEKKEKRRQRMLRDAASESQQPDNSQHGGEAEQEGHTESDDELTGPSSKSKSKGKQKGELKTKRKTPRRKETQKDMYKAFDGSALLCIGMLLQSHIYSLLANNIPDTWEEKEGGHTDNPEECERGLRPRANQEIDSNNTSAGETQTKGKGKVTEDPGLPPLDASKQIGKDTDENEEDHLGDQSSEG